jgi:putative ABC transport system permease protein
MSLERALHSAGWALSAHRARALALIASVATAAASLAFSASIIGGFSASIEHLSFGAYWRAIVVHQNVMLENGGLAPSLDDFSLLKGALKLEGGGAAWREAAASAMVGRETRTFPIFGAVGDYRPEVDATLASGRWLSPQEMESDAPLCLIGAVLAEDFQTRPKDLMLGGTRCLVVGVLAAPRSRPALSLSLGVIAPFRFVAQNFSGPDTAPREASWLTFHVRDARSREDQERMADITLRKAHGVPQSRLSPFIFEDPRAAVRDQSAQRLMTIRLLGAVTAAAVLASVMAYGAFAATMLTDRKREVALRMTFGATAGDIIAQILAEILTLNTAGSLLGVLVGLGATLAASAMWLWPVRVDAGLVLASLVAGWAPGTVIGVWTARKAAAIPPALAQGR